MSSKPAPADFTILYERLLDEDAQATLHATREVASVVRATAEIARLTEEAAPTFVTYFSR